MRLDPNLTEAHDNLGLNKLALGRLEGAEYEFRQAIALDPSFSQAHGNLGITLQKRGKLEEAEECFKIALELNPNLAATHNNLGILLKDLKRLDESEACYTRAIELNPSFAAAYHNLGNLLKELGRLAEAERSLKNAISLDPKLVDAMLDLATVFHFMNDIEAATHLLKNVVTKNTENQGLRAKVILAIYKFLEGDFRKCERYLASADGIKSKTSAWYKAEKAYHRYLTNLLDRAKTKDLEIHESKNDKVLYVIGDSHCLTSHYQSVGHQGGEILCRSILIIGCKQWHLGNPTENRFKKKFESVLSSLPRASNVLLTIGEIDCRLDDGILPHHSKYPQKRIEDIIRDTVRSYLSFVMKCNFQFQHRVIIQGVPCPNIVTTPHKKMDIKQLMDMVRIFNRELEEEAIRRDFDFLDVHRLTDRGDGFSNSMWHIDNFHLSPEGFLQAWSNYGPTRRLWGPVMD